MLSGGCQLEKCLTNDWFHLCQQDRVSLKRCTYQIVILLLWLLHLRVTCDVKTHLHTSSNHQKGTFGEHSTLIQIGKFVLNPPLHSIRPTSDLTLLSCSDLAVSRHSITCSSDSPINIRVSQRFQVRLRRDLERKLLYG